MSSLTLSASPHIHSGITTSKIMTDVFIALLPAGIMGIVYFGWSAAIIILVSVASCIIVEALLQKLMKKPVTISDMSAAVTGLILAYNLPPEVPLWIPIVGSVVAIGITKQAFGGIGGNFVNPALAARVFLATAWPVLMTSFVVPDSVSTVTPLAILKGMEANAELPAILDLAIGKIGGSIGEVSAIALLLGGLYLIIKKIINPIIPLSFIGSVALVTFAFGGESIFTGFAIHHIFAGGLMLGAIFMATDYTTSPITYKGQLIMGLGAGILTSVIRLFGGYPEGVSYSILIMNIVTPLIDRSSKVKSFGEVPNA